VFASDIQHINEQSKISNDGQGLKKIQKKILRSMGQQTGWWAQTTQLVALVRDK